MSSSTPLNILWIQTDEQRCDSLGCYGSPWARTPQLDALAQRGIVFRNHHVQSPVCVPSRVCELTSHYPHQTGILENSVHYTWGDWPTDLVTFPELFARAGYATVNLGKFHTPLHATWLENWHFEGFPDEARHFDLAPGYDETEHEVLHLDPRQRSVILAGRYPYVHGGRTPQNYLVDHAIDWLRQYPHVRRPFLLRVSFLAPHTPVLAPEPYYSLHDPAEMDWDVPDEALLHSRPRYELPPAGLERYRQHDDAAYRRMRCSYYGLVSHVDEQVGRLLDELEHLHLSDDTLIVYSSDHGDLMGEYGQFQKGMFYDLTTRVPLILAGPGIPAGQSVHELTEQVDLAPTLLRLAHLPVPAEMVGQDLLAGAPAREEVIGEIAHLPTGGDERRSRQVASAAVRRSWIRTSRWSLDFISEIGGVPTHSPEERDGKLCDLHADPLQHRNLYTDPAYADIIAELQTRLLARTSAGRRPLQVGGPRR